MISFRTRLFIIAVSIVSTALTVVLALAWSSLMKNEVDRLDERLCLETQRFTTQPFIRNDAASLESDIVTKLRLDSNKQLLFRYTSEVGMPEVKSTYWQDGINIDQLNWKSVPFRALPDPNRQLRDEYRPEAHLDNRTEASPAERAPRGKCAVSTLTVQDKQWRATTFTTPRGRGFLGVDLAATTSELQAGLKRALWLVVPLALILTALGAWLLASLTMRPVNRLRNAMKTLTQKDLHQRLPNEGEDKEFRELIDTYNTMLQRLDVSFHQASRFSGDAAHELRTPLTILQGKIEQVLNKSDNHVIQTDLTEMLDEVSRLTAITRKLLLLSHADAGKLALHTTRIDLSELLNELVVDAQMLINNQTLRSNIAKHQVIYGDILLLQQLLNNLISNAVRYCPAKGNITIQSISEKKGVTILISNTSHNINKDDRARFFDRFYRGDAAHNRKIEGNGLGLSLALEIAKAHGGDLRLAQSPQDVVQLYLWLPFKQ